MQYLQEEVEYLRDKFLQHFQRNKCGMIKDPILEEDPNLQQSFEQPKDDRRSRRPNAK